MIKPILDWILCLFGFPRKRVTASQKNKFLFPFDGWLFHSTDEVSCILDIPYIVTHKNNAISTFGFDVYLLWWSKDIPQLTVDPSKYNDIISKKKKRPDLVSGREKLFFLRNWSYHIPFESSFEVLQNELKNQYVKMYWFKFYMIRGFAKERPEKFLGVYPYLKVFFPYLYLKMELITRFFEKMRKFGNFWWRHH